METTNKKFRIHLTKYKVVTTWIFSCTNIWRRVIYKILAAYILRIDDDVPSNIHMFLPVCTTSRPRNHCCENLAMSHCNKKYVSVSVIIPEQVATARNFYVCWKDFNILRTGSFKLFERPFTGFLTILTL